MKFQISVNQTVKYSEQILMLNIFILVLGVHGKKISYAKIVINVFRRINFQSKLNNLV